MANLRYIAAEPHHFRNPVGDCAVQRYVARLRCEIAANKHFYFGVAETDEEENG